MAKIPSAELNRLAQSVPWWHVIPLGDGFNTPGSKPNQAELVNWKFPTDLTGKSVLDIGCNDGGFSVAAIQRGATKVLAIDQNFTPGMQFLLEHEVYPLEFRQLDLFDPEFLALPAFDFVIFAGVLYHVKNPLEALVRVRRVTRERALVETHIDERVSHLPCLAFYEGNELNQDGTNWWGPNRACLQAMLRVAGFAAVEVTDWQYNPRSRMGRMACLATVGPGPAPGVTNPVTAQ